MSRRRIRIAVSLDVPEGVTRERLLAYVVEAVSCWKGQLRPPGGYDDDDPGDPLFLLDRDSISASYATTKRNKRTIVRCRND